MLVDLLEDGVEFLHIPDKPGHRPSGLHVSGMVKQVMTGVDPERFDSGEFEASEWTELGVIVERAIVNALIHHEVDKDPDRWLPDCSFTVDTEHGETHGTIDIIDSVPGIMVLKGQEVSYEFAVDEIKCTWMSCKQDVTHDKFWHWVIQLKAYCRAMGTNVGRIRVFHVNGDYGSGPDPEDGALLVPREQRAAGRRKAAVLGKFDKEERRGPRYLVYGFYFTEEDLDQNWTMLMNHAEEAVREDND